jgi:signal transduction histidine kinase
MSLKNIILLSLSTFMLTVVLVNGWHYHQLTKDLSKQLGEAAFTVSKQTVESMLTRQFSRGFMLINQSQDVSRVATSRFELRTLSSLEQSVDLQLEDQSTSRSIVLTHNNQRFDIDIPRTKVEAAVEQVRKEIVISSGVIGVSSILFFWLLVQRLIRPLQEVSAKSRLIGEGQFGVEVEQNSAIVGYELKELVLSINKMSRHLQELEQQKLKLQEQRTTSEISEITRGIAHSIRNPLHTINLSVDLFQESGSDIEQLKASVKHQISRIDNYIKNMMVITSHESLSCEPINLYSLINQCIAEVKNNQSDTVNIEFICEETDLSINGLPSELQSICSTVINNALESYDKEETKEITIVLSKNDQGIEIRVKDFGQGVSPEIADKLFQPHTTNKAYGAGMGLYISNRIVKGRYQGAIHYQPNSPKGSIFSIQLKDRVND